MHLLSCNDQQLSLLDRSLDRSSCPIHHHFKDRKNLNLSDSLIERKLHNMLLICFCCFVHVWHARNQLEAIRQIASLIQSTLQSTSSWSEGVCESPPHQCLHATQSIGELSLMQFYALQVLEGPPCTVMYTTQVLTQHPCCRQSSLTLQAVHAAVASELRVIMQHHKCDAVSVLLPSTVACICTRWMFAVSSPFKLCLSASAVCLQFLQSCTAHHVVLIARELLESRQSNAAHLISHEINHELLFNHALHHHKCIVTIHAGSQSRLSSFVTRIQQCWFSPNISGAAG